jgi:hypothetical protein
VERIAGQELPSAIVRVTRDHQNGHVAIGDRTNGEASELGGLTKA